MEHRTIVKKQSFITLSDNSENLEKRKTIFYTRNLNRLHLNRLFRFGLILFVTSITTSLTWLVLALVLNNSNISNTYSLVSPIQYVVNLIFAIFGSGACIKKEKESDNNAIGSGFVFGLGISFVVFLLLSIFADRYIAYFGFDAQFYTPYVRYYFGLFFVQNVFNMVMQKLYFEDKEKLASIFVTIFYVSNFILLILLSLITQKFVVSASITLAVLFIYSLVLAFRLIGRFQLKFNFLTNMKYSSASIASSIFMFCIYLFGLQTVFSMGNEYVVAMNFVALCMNMPWSCLSAISTAAQIDIAKKRLKYTRSVKIGYLYSAILLVVAVVMFCGLFKMYDVSMKIALVYVAFQLFDYVTWTLLDILSALTQLDFSPAVNTCIDITTKVARICCSLFIMSPYCTNIGAAVNAVIAMVSYLIVRFGFYKLKNGVLIRKQDLNKSESKDKKII